MAGSELDGLDGADGDMFDGAVWVLTPDADTADATFATVAAVVAELGAEVVALPPERHDQVVAVVSHVPHLTAATLMGLASDRAEEHAALLRLAAGGFRDMTRIASRPAGDLARHLRREPRRPSSSALDGLIDGLATMRDVVDDDDRDGAARPAAARPARRAPTCPSRVNQPSELAEVRIPIPDRTGRRRRGVHAGRRARRQHRQLRGGPQRRGQPRRRRRAGRRGRRPTCSAAG